MFPGLSFIVNVKGEKDGWPGRIRTYDQSVNSRLLYH
jgi:hypothetical protein